MTNIYRYVNLLELFSILKDFKLKFTQLSLMEDPNEGLALSLNYQDSFIFYLPNEKIISHHEAIKAQTYISCWTTEPDLMAMWLLYSKNRDSIRIKTSTHKLEKALSQYGEDNHLFRNLNKEENSIVLLGPPKVRSVQYVSFEEIMEKIKKRFDIYEKKCDEMSINKETENDAYLLHQEFDDNKVMKQDELEFLKDKNFKHEQEVRGSFKVYLKKKFTQENDNSNLFSNFGNFVYHSKTDRLPYVIQVPVDECFIESICFDPRMPEHIKAGMLKIIDLVNPNITIESSCAFGYKLDSVHRN